MHTINLNILGASQVGKTAFMMRHIKGDFLQTPGNPTKSFNLVLDTNAGPVLFKVQETLTPDPHADAYLLMFDLTNWSSYDYAFDQVEMLNDLGKPVVICGNKVDLPGRVVKPRMINIHHQTANSHYYDISACSNYNYEKPFCHLCEILVPGYVRLTEPGIWETIPSVL